MEDGEKHIRHKFSTILFSPLSSNKKIFAVWLIVIFALIVDMSLGNLGNLISTTFNPWKIYLFLSISIIYATGQFFILKYLKVKTLEIGTKRNLHLAKVFKIVAIVQSALIGILLVVIMQMLLTSHYNVAMLTAAIMVSYVLAISMMLLLSKRFFSWFRTKKNTVGFLYGLASATIAIELGLTLVITITLLQSLGREAAANLISPGPSSPAIGNVINIINSFYIIFSVASFVVTWVATVFLLRHYSRKLGKLKFWVIVSLPLFYFLLQFVSFFLNTYISFLSENPVFYSILTTLIFTLSKPAGGILFGVAFWAMAKNIRQDSVVRDYLIISAYGLLLLFISDQAITLIAVPYPPFGLATISFIGLSSYLIVVGIYSSAISVAADSNLRQSIRGLALRESKLLDSIGTAQMEHEIQAKVITLVRKTQDDLERESGASSSLSDDDISAYLKDVLREIESKKISKQ